MQVPLGPLTLTPTEWAIVRHRLEIPEAIASCLTEYAEGDVLYVCSRLLHARWDQATDRSEAITLGVIADCVDGSTYCASLEDAVEMGDVSKSRQRTIKKNAASLSEKVSDIVGRRVECSLY